MRGPEVGTVDYSQPGGNLALRIGIEFGQPNTRTALSSCPESRIVCPALR